VERSAADVDYLRGYNEALVVSEARRAATFDRATIAAATGLTPQAVSKVIARLTEAGLVAVDGQRRGGVGKPTTVHRLVATSRYAVGAHVARRTLRLVLTDLRGAVVAGTVRPLPADFTPDQLLDGVAAGLAALLAGHPHAADRLDGVGIGMVGPLDHANGVVRDAHGLSHWHDVPLRDLASSRLGPPRSPPRRGGAGPASGTRRSCSSNPASAPASGWAAGPTGARTRTPVSSATP